MTAEDRFADGFAPEPSAMSIYDFAQTTPMPDGPLVGTKINPRLERAVDLWLQTLASGKYQWHVQVAPSQRAKTTTGIILPFLHGLVQERVNVGYIMPNLEKLAQKWEGSLKPMIEGCGYGAYLPEKGPGSQGGRPAVLRIADPVTRRRIALAYFMALGKGGSETSTSSNPCQKLLIDEADDAENAGQLRLAMKRTASYGAAGGGVVVSTVNIRSDRSNHPILELTEEGTKTRMAHLCPHCGNHSPINLENFDHSRGCIVCPRCDVLWSEADRHSARNNAIYQHGNPDAEIFSVLYVQPDYFWEYPDKTGRVQLAMQALASEHRSALAAKDRDPSLWGTYLRKSWCRDDLEGDGEIPVTVDLHVAARAQAEIHRRGVIPQTAAVVTVGGDTGKRDAWALSLGMDRDLRWWIIDWHHSEAETEKVEPSPEDQRAFLEKLSGQVHRLGRANAMGIDVGYNRDLVEDWAVDHSWQPMRGDYREITGEKTPGILLPSWVEYRRQKNGRVWLFVDGATVKAEIHKGLARLPGEPGAGHLPQGVEAGDRIIQHLTSEAWDAKRAVWVVKPGRRNHLLDCLVYAYALAVIQLRMPQQTTIVPEPPTNSEWLGDTQNWSLQ